MEAGGGAWPPLARHPVSQPMGKRGILDEIGVQLGPMGVRSPMCERLGASPTLPGLGGSQPQRTFEGCELFWQVLFITVLLVTEKLLQRQEDKC